MPRLLDSLSGGSSLCDEFDEIVFAPVQDLAGYFARLPGLPVE
jgi:hypothetical protein